MPQIIAPAIAAGLGVSAGTAAVIANVVVVVAGTLASTGLSAIARSIAGADERPRFQSSAPIDRPIRQTIQQSTPPERYIYGRALVGGAVFFAKSKPPYLIIGYLVAAHRCDALEAVYINGLRCEFTAGGEAKTPDFRKNGTPYMEISTRLGDPDQAIDPLLAAEYPDLPAEFRQRGITTVVCKAYYGDDFNDHESVWGSGGGTFRPQFLMRGKPVYDPTDSAQDRDDETTWKWSDNWALCLADWIRAEYGGRKRATQIDYESMPSDIRACNQSIGTSDGGSEKRYTVGAGITSTENPFTVLDSFLKCAGESAALWRRGKCQPFADIPRSAVRTLTQDDLVGPFTFRNERPRSSSLNSVTSAYFSATRDYKPAETPPLEDAALIASDGQELPAQVQRPFVIGDERAQRLDNITLKRSRLGRELRFAVDVTHLDLEVGDVVNIEMADFSFLDGTYAILNTAFDQSAQTVSLVLQQAPSAAVHEWDPATQVQSVDLDAEVIEVA